MTKDETISMARQAGFELNMWQLSLGCEVFGTHDELEAFAKLVEAHTRGQIFQPDWDNYRQGLIDGAVSEREACAQICDRQHKDPLHYSATGEAKWLSILIRQRGEA